MKKHLMIITCLLMSLTITVNSYSKDKAKEPSSILTFDESGNYFYSKVFDIPGRSQVELYDAVKKWIVKNIKSQSNTNYFDDEKKSTVSTTPIFAVAYNSNIAFKLNIDIKNNKYKLSATSFLFINPQGIQKNLGDYSGISTNKKVRAEILADVDESVKKIIESIEKSAKSGGNDDW